MIPLNTDPVSRQIFSLNHFLFEFHNSNCWLRQGLIEPHIFYFLIAAWALIRGIIQLGIDKVKNCSYLSHYVRA